MSFSMNNFLHCLMPTDEIWDQVSFREHNREIVSRFIIVVSPVIGRLNFYLQLTLSTAGIVLFVFVLFFNFLISLFSFITWIAKMLYSRGKEKNLETSFLKLWKIHTSTLPIPLNDLKYSHDIFSSTQQSEIYWGNKASPSKPFPTYLTVSYPQNDYDIATLETDVIWEDIHRSANGNKKEKANISFTASRQ